MSSVGGFVLQRPIAVGGMGEVWRATAPDGTLVAIKVARARPGAGPAETRLLEGEVRALARLDHPGIAWLYDHGRTGPDGPFEPGSPYLVLEHCGGGTLAERTFEEWAGVRDVVVGLLEALAHAHAHGIVHRDLKPQNVLWASSTDVRPGMKLADFGVAHELGSGSQPSRVGTPWYMAPEQAGPAQFVGPWTDLYALGAVAWELVTGDPPNFGESVAAVLASARTGPGPFRPLFAVPDGLEEWLRALLHPDTTRRTRHAAHAHARLARLDPNVRPPTGDWRTVRPAGPRLRLQGAGLNLVALREPDLTGREAEREALWTELEAVRTEQRLGVVVLRGVSGIGKSRLCRWLAERAAELGLAEPISVGCREGTPLLDLLAGLLAPPGVADRVAAVETALSAPEVDRLGPPLRSPGRPWGTLPMVRRVVCREVGQRPRLLVLDDAQHSIDAVRFARALWADRPKVPLLVVVAVEEELLAREPDVRHQVDALGDGEGVRTLQLGPLSAAEGEELLEGLVGLDPEARSAVLARAAGHPGYVVALVTSWAGRGALTPSRRGFRLVAGAEAPAESWSSVWARWMRDWLATLDREDRLLLEQAAAIGRVVDEGLWERVSDDPEAKVPLDRVVLDVRSARRRAALVDRLVTAGLAYDTDQGFTFTHPALVELLLEQARSGYRLRGHHLDCANQLRRWPQPDFALDLGHHLAEAGQYDEASEVLLAGIDWHWRHRDRRPLLTQLERAERCADQAGWAEDDPRRADLLRARSLLMTTAGRPDEGAQLARRAWALAVRLGDRALVARTVWRLVDTLVVASRWEDAMIVIPSFLEVEDAASDPAMAGIARVRMGRGWLARGDSRSAEAWFADGERTLLSIPTTVMSLSALLELYDFSGRPERTLEVGAQLEPLAYEEGRADVRLFAMSKQVEAMLQLKRFAPGIALARECLRANDPLGDKRFSLYMRVELGVLLLRDGQLAEARATFGEVLGELDRRESTWLTMVALLGRCDCALGLGDLEALDRDVDEIAVLIAMNRYERDSLIHRLERLRDALGERGQRSRAEFVDAQIRRVTEPDLATRTADLTAGT